MICSLSDKIGFLLPAYVCMRINGKQVQITTGGEIPPVAIWRNADFKSPMPFPVTLKI